MVYCGEAEFSASRAAAMTYGKCDGIEEEGGSMAYNTAKSIGAQNMAKVNIQECISDILQVTTMPKEEVLNRISKMASANVDDMLDIDPTTGKATLNLYKAKQRGALFLLKKINYDTFGNIKSVEMHDSFAALVKLGQHHRLFDRQQERPLDAREEAKALLEELRDKHGHQFDDHILVEKVVAQYSNKGITANDLVEEPTEAIN